MATTKHEVRSSTRETHLCYFEATSGAAGAIPSTFTRSREIVSVTNDGTAKTWTFVIEAPGAVALLSMSPNIVNASYSASTSVTKAEILSETVNGSAKNIVVQFRKNDGTPTSPASGDVVKIRFDFKRSQGLA